MTLDEAGRDIETPKAIRHPIGGDRVAVFITRVEGGVVFAEPGWVAPMGLNRLHFIPGEPRGPEDGPWTIGGAEIRLIDHGDDLGQASNDYQQARRTDDLLAMETWPLFLQAVAEREGRTPITA